MRRERRQWPGRLWINMRAHSHKRAAPAKPWVIPYRLRILRVDTDAIPTHSAIATLFILILFSGLIRLVYPHLCLWS
jgi:hypothetical protein